MNTERQLQTPTSKEAGLVQLPTLILFWGAPAAGKSSLAEQICEQWRQAGQALTYLSSDAVNQTILGGEFVSKMRPAIYDTLRLLAARSLQAGLPVIVDGTYLQRQARHELLNEGESRGILSVSVLVHCDLEERLRRNSLRDTQSRVPDVWVEKAHWAAEYQKREASLVLDTGKSKVESCIQSITEMVERRMRRLRGSIPRFEQNRSYPSPSNPHALK
jgi:predicted kinase